MLVLREFLISLLEVETEILKGPKCGVNCSSCSKVRNPLGAGKRRRGGGLSQEVSRTELW